MADCEMEGCEREGILRSAKNSGDKPNHELHAYICDPHWEPLQSNEQARRLRDLTDARKRT